MRRLNSTIDGRNLAQVQEALEPFGVKVSEGLRIGLNLLASALPVLADGGSIVFRSQDEERTYAIPISDQLGQAWLPESDEDNVGAKRLTGSIPDGAYFLVKAALSRYGLTMSQGMRKGLNLFAAALPTLSRPKGEIVLRAANGEEQSFRFPFLTTSITDAPSGNTGGPPAKIHAVI